MDRHLHSIANRLIRTLTEPFLFDFTRRTFLIQTSIFVQFDFLLMMKLFLAQIRLVKFVFTTKKRKNEGSQP